MNTVKVCHCSEAPERHIHVTGSDGSRWLLTGDPHGAEGVRLP